MNDAKLKLLVADTVALDRKVQQLTSELDEKKALLVAEAKARADTATKTEGGGTSVTLEGLNGCIARITRAGKTLKASLSASSDELTKVQKLLAGKFDEEWQETAFDFLFAATTKYELVEDFRAEAERILGSDLAAKLLKLVTNPGKTTVSFETKEGA